MELIYDQPILTLLFISTAGFWVTVAASQINIRGDKNGK